MVAALLLGTSPAAGQTPPAESGERTHDGFYLRLSVGGGYLSSEFSGGEKTPDTHVSGGGAMLDVLLGGTPVPGLVVGGGYQFEMAQNADYDAGKSTGTGNLARGVIGPFVEWFPDPNGGFSVGLLGGYTLVALDTLDIRILGVDVGNDIKTTGVSGNLWVGYAHWLSSQWSLGLAARAGLASTKNRDDSSQAGTTQSYGLLLTAVYH
jgi:hypothetical protein